MKSKHFKIHELVPPHLYNVIDDYVLWEMVDSRLIKTIDAIKEEFPAGTMTINNYMYGGNREWSGLRTKNSQYYSKTSQHTKFKAIDAIFSAYTTDEVRSYIIDNPKKFPFIKGIELKVSWLHVDIRDSTKVMLFYA